MFSSNSPFVKGLKRNSTCRRELLKSLCKEISSAKETTSCRADFESPIEDGPSSPKISLRSPDIPSSSGVVVRSPDHTYFSSDKVDPNLQDAKIQDPQDVPTSFGDPQDATISFGDPQDATTSFCDSLNSTTSFGDPLNATTSFGDPLNATTSFGDSEDATTSFSDPQDATTSFGDPLNATTSFGDPLNATNSFGDSQDATTSFGDPQDATTSLGDPQDATTSFCDPLNSTTSFGDSEDATTSFGDPQDATTSFGDPLNATTSFGNPQDPNKTLVFEIQEDVISLGLHENTEFVVMEDGSLEAVYTEKEGGDKINFEVATEIEIVAEADENEVQTEFTKSGEPRKRKKYVYSPRKRSEIKKTKLKRKHCITEKCNCKLNCGTLISEDQRVKINEEYWSMTQLAQKSFILGAIKKQPVKRRTTIAGDSRRNESVQYFFKNREGFSRRVCKVFFLTTLGYAKSNDRIIQNMCKVNGLSPKIDGRKGKPPANKIDRTLIVNHIRSFKPKISHYRREHAPNRLYLPSDLSITKMYEDFKKNHRGFSCSYELYREEIEKMRISFVKLGHEECESCEHFNLHPHDKENLDSSCEICKFWKVHQEKAKDARQNYLSDKEKEKDADEIIYSMDMQKVIMLPRLDMFKNVIFTLRLSVYNLTFAPVGSKDKSCIVPVLWHEAIRGRKQEDIISALMKFLVSSEARDAKKIILWADNCSSQNKNWAFFSFLIYIINSSVVSAREITIKYFEPGHTFMSADSFHHSVEKSMKMNKQSKVYDFNDFKEATAQASKKVQVQEMLVEDFSNWRSYMSVKKLSNVPDRPYLHDIVSVKVERGSLLLSYKKKLDDKEWKDLDFLLMKIIKTNNVPAPAKCSIPRGISTMRKGGIINLIKGRSSVIPENRVEFWHSLPLTPNDGREDASDTDDENCP